MARVRLYRRTNPSSTRSLLPRVLVSAAGLMLVGLTSVVVVAPASASAKAGSGVAWVRAAHLVPGVGATAVDLVPDAGTAAVNVVMSPDASYGDVTGYQKVPPGAYTVSVRPDSAASNAPMLERHFVIANGQAMTLAVVGTQQSPRLATLLDDLTPPAAGKVRVRVFAAVSAAQELTVQVVSGPTIARSAVLGQATGYRSVPAGRWDLRVTADQMKAAQEAVRLHAGGVYTVIALQGAAQALAVKVVTDAAGMPGALPRGGAQTGGGGMAPRDGSALRSSTALVGSGLVGGLCVMTALLLVRRRSVRVSARG